MLPASPYRNKPGAKVVGTHTRPTEVTGVTGTPRRRATRRWMLLVGRDIGDGAVCEFCIDITDLKRAEEANRDPAG